MTVRLRYTEARFWVCKNVMCSGCSSCIMQVVPLNDDRSFLSRDEVGSNPTRLANFCYVIGCVTQRQSNGLLTCKSRFRNSPHPPFCESFPQALKWCISLQNWGMRSITVVGSQFSLLACRSAVDQVTVNHSVVGSIPTTPAILCVRPSMLQRTVKNRKQKTSRQWEGLSVWVSLCLSYEV